MPNSDLLKCYFDVIREFFANFPGHLSIYDYGIYTRDDVNKPEGKLRVELKPDYQNLEEKGRRIICSLQNAFQGKGVESQPDDYNFGISIKKHDTTFLITITAYPDMVICSIIEH